MTVSALGDVPHLPHGLVPIAQGDQRPGEVLDEGHCVRSVGVAEQLGRLSRDRSGEYPIAYGREVDVGTEEVRPPPNRRLDSARLVSPHQGLGDPSPGPAVRARCQVGQVFREWSAHRAIGLKVVTEYEPRRGRPLDD